MWNFGTTRSVAEIPTSVRTNYVPTSSNIIMIKVKLTRRILVSHTLFDLYFNNHINDILLADGTFRYVKII